MLLSLYSGQAEVSGGYWDKLMEELTLTGSALLSALKPNLERYLWLPAETAPDMSDEDWQAEIDRMFEASLLTRRFVDGQISPDDYADGLADTGYDPNQLADMWEAGVSLGY